MMHRKINLEWRVGLLLITPCLDHIWVRRDLELLVTELESHYGNIGEQLLPHRLLERHLAYELSLDLMEQDMVNPLSRQ